MTVQVEGLVLDGLDLNSSPWTLEAFANEPPAQRAEWVQSMDADGAALVREPRLENRECTLRLRVDRQASMDLALAQLSALSDKLGLAARNPDGLDMVWTPAGASRSLTLRVLNGRVTGLPLAPTGGDAGWFQSTPVVTVALTCAPAMLMAPLTDAVDSFAVDSIAAGDWTFDAGAGSLAVSGGQLVPSSTVQKRLVHARPPYEWGSVEVTVKVVTGASVASGQVGAVVKRVGVNDYLMGEAAFAGAATEIRVRKVVAGVATTLAASVVPTPVAATAYWVRARITGDTVRAEWWTSAPTATGTATTATGTTLTGTDATLFGGGVTGRSGIVFQPAGTDWRLDDYQARPNVAVTGSGGVAATMPLSLLVPGVPGDLPPAAELVVTDGQGAARRTVQWGAGVAASLAPDALAIDSSMMVTTGFTGSLTVSSGAVSPDAKAVRATLTGAPLALGGLGSRSSRGPLRVLARVLAPNTDTRVRLAYSGERGELLTLPWQQPAVTGAWCQIDLGAIVAPSDGWTGQIEAMSASGGNLDVDVVSLLPAVAAGVARAPSVARATTTFAARDSFQQPADVVVAGKTLPIGGVWAGAGAAIDFGLSGVANMYRTAISDAAGMQNGRLLTANGTSAMTATSVGITFKHSAVTITRSGVLARYTDPSNFLALYAYMQWAGTLRAWLVLEQRVAGTSTTLHSEQIPVFAVSAPVSVALTVLADGQWSIDRGASRVVPGFSTQLAAGGALAAGRVGVIDHNGFTDACSRTYTEFWAQAPTVGDVIAAGDSARVDGDGDARHLAAGVVGARVPAYRGSPFQLVHAGPEGRINQVAVMAARSDLVVGPDTSPLDKLEMQVRFTPRCLVVPR